MTTHESDAALSRRAARRGDEQDARVVTMLQELAPQLDVEPDPEYRRAARQRLVAMAAVRTPEPVRSSPLRRLLAARAVDAPAGRWRTWATAGLAGAALTVTSLATLVALSTGARPGDVLYGVKRGTEQTQLALAGDSRGQALLDLARTRLDELAAVDGDASLVRSTLATMDDQTSEGASWHLARALDTSDTALLDRLTDWTTDQSAQLDAVRADVPPPATEDVEESLELLEGITVRITQVRTALACPDGVRTADEDRLGPVPGGCLPGTGAREDTIASESPSTPPSSGGTAVQPTVPSAPSAGPTSPAGPSGQRPAPRTVPPQDPSSAPVPITPPHATLDLPRPLPDLTLPTLTPRPATPAAPSTTPTPPAIDVPVDIGICLQLPPLVRAGKC